jgi:iron complex transport system substrate-binding protein
MKAAIKTLGRLAFGLVLFVFVGWQAAEAGDYVCRDKLGRVITLQVPVKRAVMNQMYDFIPALNLWDQVAGLNRWAFEDEILNALCPELERRYARIGTGSEINMERLIKLRPDVIVTWTSKPEQIHFIGRQGIPVIGVYPESLREFYSVIDMLGAVFGREAEARRLKQRMNAEFKLIQPRVAGIQHKRKVVWLGSRPTYPSAGIGINDELIRLAGAVNPAGTIKQRNVEVSLEQLIKWNPDVIFIWGNAGYTAADLRAKPQWRVIKAVREGRVYKAPEFSTWSPLLAPVALWVAVRIYPEAFGDIDFDARADRFCRDIYGFSIKRIGGFVD